MLNYTLDDLNQLSIRQLKAIAAENSIDIKDDARYKKSWVYGIFAAVAIQAPAVKEEVETVSETAELNIEADILAEIDRVADAEQAAIFANNQEDARQYSDRLDELNNQYEALIRAQMGLLASKSIALLDKLPETAIAAMPEAPIEPVQVDVHWTSPLLYGSVSIDGGNSYRAFRVIDPTTDYPVIKLMTRAGEIDSRWRTTAGNRYIQAVRESLQAHLDQI